MEQRNDGNETVPLPSVDQKVEVAALLPEQSSKNREEAAKYQKKTQLEHIIARPDTYIGAVETCVEEMFFLKTAEQKSVLTACSTGASDRDDLCARTFDRTVDRLEAQAEEAQAEEADSGSQSTEGGSSGFEMVKGQVSLVPGLLKIFDEIMVNATDNAQRDSNTTTLHVKVQRDTGQIEIKNNGKGIPVMVHPEEKVYVPEMVFGHLLTSSNFDDSVQKTTGGRNGFGAKLTNIFSRSFRVETLDSQRGLLFRQDFRANMTQKQEPVLLKKAAKPGSDYTKITFVPDYARFGLPQGLDAVHFDLFRKRTFDAAGTAPKRPKRLRVYFNGTRVPCSDFKTYAAAFTGRHRSVYVRLNAKWEVVVSDSGAVSEPGGVHRFQHVSFVNGIETRRGGKHVDAVAAQLTAFLAGYGARKRSLGAGTALKPNLVRTHLFLLINCLIENPAFSSQTKEVLTTNPKKFGSFCRIPDSALEKIARGTDVVALSVQSAQRKQNLDLKKSDGKKSKTLRLTGVPKLEDANKAGSRRARDCTLILTEGDSAKALAVSGLGIVGRDTYGVFPLKGKLLNVRNASASAVAKNAEINQLKKIIGLKQDAVYSSSCSEWPLRYGHVLIMTDQDQDGSHIKGLVLNLFARFWPSLLQIPGFLQFFITPVVKVKLAHQRGRGGKGAAQPSETLAFYSLPEFCKWKSDRTTAGNAQGAIQSIKYYKGLGTSTSDEGREYFRDMGPLVKNFEYQASPNAGIGPGAQQLSPDEDAMDLAFNKKRAEDRKKWLGAADGKAYLDYSSFRTLKVERFVNEELVLFSDGSNRRAIPSVLDGLKPGQRKVLYACFKRKLSKEIRVAQLAGYVSEHTDYHHGENSLVATIIKMAQGYVGANNLAWLQPVGQFGTRHENGNDAASARYINTNLSPLARAVFRREDDAVLPPQLVDGQQIEPETFAPVIPTVLANGSSGIGTGWSSSVPNFNPRDLAQNVLLMLSGTRAEDLPALKPWYRHFQGTVSELRTKSSDGKGRNRGFFEVKGCVEADARDSKVLLVTELPLVDTQSYKVFLDSLVQKGHLSGFHEHHTEEDVRFQLNCTSSEVAQKLLASFSSGTGSSGISSSLNAAEPPPPDEGEREGADDPSSSAASTTTAKGKTSPSALDLRLTGVLSTGNMVLFDSRGVLKRYEDINEIQKDFFEARLPIYSRRKAVMLQELKQQMDLLHNKVRFVNMVNSGELQVSRKSRKDVVSDLRRLRFQALDPERQAEDGAEGEGGEKESVEDGESVEKGKGNGLEGFGYLLRLPLISLTSQMVARLEKDARLKTEQFTQLQNQSPQDLWRQDIAQFLLDLDKEEAAMALKRRQRAAEFLNAQSGTSKNKAKPRARKRKPALPLKKEPAETGGPKKIKTGNGETPPSDSASSVLPDFSNVFKPEDYN